MKDKEKLPKRQDKNPVDEALDFEEEITELEEDPVEEDPQFEKAKVEAVNLMTITNKLTKLDKDVFDMGASLDVALESIKALGANVIENNDDAIAAMNDLSAQMATLNAAFIKYQATNLSVPIPTPKAVTSTQILHSKSVATTGQPPSLDYIEAIDWQEGKYGHFTYVFASQDSQELNPKALQLIKYLQAVGGKANIYGMGYKINGRYLNQSDKPYKNL